MSGMPRIVHKKGESRGLFYTNYQHGSCMLTLTPFKCDHARTQGESYPLFKGLGRTYLHRYHRHAKELNFPAVEAVPCIWNYMAASSALLPGNSGVVAPERAVIVSASKNLERKPLSCARFAGQRHIHDKLVHFKWLTAPTCSRCYLRYCPPFTLHDPRVRNESLNSIGLHGNKHCLNHAKFTWRV